MPASLRLIALCCLALLVSLPACTAQDDLAGVPPSFLIPIGSGPVPADDPAAPTLPAGGSSTPTLPPNGTPITAPNPGVGTPDPVDEPLPTLIESPPAEVPPLDPLPTALPPAELDPLEPLATTPGPAEIPPAVVTPPVAAPVAAPVVFLSPPAAPVVVLPPPAALAPIDRQQVGVDAGAEGPAAADPIIEAEAPPPLVEEDLPPGPPMDWQALPTDTEIVFGILLEGPALVPWTKSKSWVFTNVLQSRYLRSCDVDDIETGPLETTNYVVPVDSQGGARRRLFYSRRLMQGVTYEQVSKVHLRVKVKTNKIRVESEVRTVVDGVSSGALAKDLTLSLGSEVSNTTLTAQPTTNPLGLEDPNASSGGSLPGWIIGCIVGAVLVLMPIPAYILYKRHKRKHLEAVEKQQAEAAAARQRMQSRIIKSGGKSFSRGGPGSEHDILARTGSLAGSVYALGPDGTPREDSMSLPLGRDGSFARNNPWSPTPRGPTPQQQLYQQQSLGPGGGVSPSMSGRMNSMTGGRSMNGRAAAMAGTAVYPVMRSSDEASTSSGNVSERH